MMTMFCAALFLFVNPDNDAVLKKLDELKSHLDRIDDKIKKDRAREIEEIKEALKDLKREIDLLKKKPSVKEEADEVGARVARLEALTKKNPAELQYGKVRVINMYPDTAYAVSINGEEYEVKGGETKVIDFVASGTFHYQIQGVTGVRKRTLVSGNTFTIRIRPDR